MWKPGVKEEKVGEKQNTEWRRSFFLDRIHQIHAYDRHAHRHFDRNPDEVGMQWRNLCPNGMDYTIAGQISRLRSAALEMTVIIDGKNRWKYRKSNGANPGTIPGSGPVRPGCDFDEISSFFTFFSNYFIFCLRFCVGRRQLYR